MAHPSEDLRRPNGENNADIRPVYKTTIEHKLGVEFPGGQSFFGIIGEVGRYSHNLFLICIVTSTICFQREQFN